MSRILRYVKRRLKLRNLRTTYIQTLSYLKENKVKIVSEREFYYLNNKKGPMIILRHDVDRNVKKIDVLREIENNFDVQSTLHLRTRKKGYLEKMRKINLESFDVSLHIEFNNLAEAKEDMKKLEYLSGKRVIGCSMHGGRSKTKLKKDELVEIMKKAGLRYIGDFNFTYNPIKYNGITLLPYMISDIGVGSAKFKEFKKAIDKLIKHKGISEMNIHPEYL